MAKILITFLQPIIGNNQENLICYYESLSKELKDNNNEVLLLNTINENSLKKNKQKKALIKNWVDDIKNFAPDIIFAFNNQIFEEIINETDCPIVLFEADLMEYFVRTELIAKYKDRYYMATFCPQYINQYINLGFYRQNILLLNYATSIHKEDKEKIHNIAFIGSSFQNRNKQLRSYLDSFDDTRLYEMLREFWQTHNYDYKSLADKYYPDNKFTNIDYYRIFDSRIYVLQSVLDLGLKLYGVYWNHLPQELLPVKGAFDKTPKYSLKHNQDVYNSSLINLSISHPQCEGYAFPWRIFDIMASSGLLISSYSSHLNEITKGYVNIPMFNSPYEARDLCIKFLNEKNLRDDIIYASNEFIEKFGRWNSNFKIIEQAVNIRLTNANNVPKTDFIRYEIKKKEISTIKRRTKNFINSISLAFMQLPIIDRLYSKKIKNKLYSSIIKYNKELREMFND